MQGTSSSAFLGLNAERRKKGEKRRKSSQFLSGLPEPPTVCPPMGTYDDPDLVPQQDSTIDTPLDLPASTPLFPRLNSLPPPPTSSRKRSLEPSDLDSASPPPKRPSSSPPDVVFRLLVSSSKIGRVIGKQGSRIRELRGASPAQIKITDPLAKGEDRVITISSKEGITVDSLTAAEQMLIQIAMLVADEHDESSLLVPMGLVPSTLSNSIRLVIGRSQIGCLIGKEGSIIKDIRENTGASVWVMPLEQTPFTSCLSDSDRLVQISGELLQVQEALRLISKHLKVNPPKESITLKPTYHQQLMRYAQAAYPGGYAVQFSSNINLSTTNGGIEFQNPAATPMTSMTPKITSEMTVPSALMGGIIGRGGINITYARSLSGCVIKVHNQEDGKTARRITFEGTTEQVTAAQNLVQAFMNAQ